MGSLTRQSARFEAKGERGGLRPMEVFEFEIRLRLGSDHANQLTLQSN